MATINPIALATKGVIGKGGNVDPLGLATIGVLIIGISVPPIADDAIRRTQLLTLMGRFRR